MKDGAIFDSEKADRERARSPHSLLRLQRQYYAIPRPIRIFAAVIATIAIFWGLKFHVEQERDFALKHTPSDFRALARKQPESLWHPERPIRHINGTHIDDRYIFMRHLGEGREGTASLFVDVTNGDVVVVKQYFWIMRNNVPDSLASDFSDFTSKWQSEIEASLFLGSWKNGNETAYVPLRDYFILQTEASQWHWTIVTPFIEGGTLENLAASTKFQERTPQKLDKIFRPVLEKIILNLGVLHAAGYCHDDIKMDNIFIADTKSWLLGDLGQVRHLDHPWHSTKRWKRENQWSDCALNDLRRIIKTYMSFLRAACGDTSDFDLSFYAAEQAWSKFYWQWMLKPVHVTEMLQMSKTYDSANDPEWKSLGHATGEADACLRRRIDLEVHTMRIHYQLQDFWPFNQC